MYQQSPLEFFKIFIEQYRKLYRLNINKSISRLELLYDPEYIRVKFIKSTLVAM